MIEIPRDKIKIGQPVNAEWHALAGRENRYPNQFGEANKMMLDEASFRPEEAAQLRERGVVFPLEIAEPEGSVVIGKDLHI